MTTAEDTPLLLTLTGSDVDGNPLIYSVVAQPAHGALTGTAPNLTYTPAANYNGSDSFTFTANDGSVVSAPATVAVTVNPVNDAPAANAQSVSTTRNTAVAVVLTGSDVDGDALAFAVAAAPANGSLTGDAPNLVYTPADGYEGADSFTFTANDGAASSTEAAVSITVTRINQQPTADVPVRGNG